VPIVDVAAPASGVVTEQNVTTAAGVKSLDNSPNLFTISDLSRVWIVCDVYENDLPAVRVGDTAEVRLAAYPDRVLTGRIDNIAAMLDPTIRTAKVRIEVRNPGLLRIGMFVTATFKGLATETRAVVPATAVLHLHDRDWVYVPVARDRFERRAVAGGPMLAGNLQELRSGVRPGEQVIANALVFQNAVEQ
jgi:membrane fusion protein, heavy metal efflux system